MSAIQMTHLRDPEKQYRREHATDQTEFTSTSCSTNDEGQKDIEGLVKYVLRDIRKHDGRQDGRRKSKAFLLVRGGNVYFIKKLMDYLRERGFRKELNWLLGCDAYTADRGQPIRGMKRHHNKYYVSVGAASGISASTTVCHVLGSLLVFVLFVVLTPMFYIVHSIFHQIYMTWCWKRPSKNADLSLFYTLLSQNPDMVKLFLRNGSSVMSQDADGNNIYHYLADMSLEAPHEAWRCHRLLCTCITDNETLREVITRQQNGVGLTALEVAARSGSIHFFDKISNDDTAFGLVRLMVTRNSLVVEMRDPRKATELGHGCTPTAKVDIVKEADAGDAAGICLRVIDIDISMYEKNDIMGRQSYPLQLISSRNVDTMSEIDVNSLLNCSFLNKWMQRKLRHFFVYIVLGHIIELLITFLFLVYLIDQGGDMTIFPLIRPFFDLYLEEGVNISVRSNETNVSLDENGRLMTPCYDLFVNWYNGSVNRCTAHALDALDKVCSPLSRLTQLTFMFIMDNLEFDDSESTDVFYQYVIAGILSFKVVLDLMLRLSFLYNNYNFGASSFASGMAPLLFRRIPGSYTERQVMLFMATMFALFLYSAQLLNEAVVTEDGRYINRWVDFYFDEDPVRLAARGALYNVNTFVRQKAALLGHFEPLVSKLVVICLLFRFMLSIHVLRLLPGIGFFIITTKKMAKHLCQFAVVFVIVSLAFAAIFHFIMRNPQCPAVKKVGFESLAESLFSAYQIAIGGASYDFTDNTNARIAFIIYTLISAMLLLNLIIAVMTTTAQELNRVPWRQGMCAVERWDEILGTEVMVRMLLWPVTKSCQLLRTLGLRNVGFFGDDGSLRRIEVVQVTDAT
ncbi:hypothetical protein LSH36_664g00022 [Paralvinella palmiformis]|uniref:Ion transport domain-containing protein n=1 Tax=Paralvinella palmiformis TaxID=53620 RepID=A0AAD9MTX3_9ANNE|nr:hypothetical protein LSH36_664g00022 [Paralvinella palmiformis]